MAIAKKNNNNGISSDMTYISIIVSISGAHYLNDIMQSMLPAIYPLLRDEYALTFLQIGIITSVYQITGSILQPLIGYITDKKPFPYSLPFASVFTMLGLLTLSLATNYHLLLLGAALVGFGSSIFHPEAARVTRLASGGRNGYAQSIFQVGGNAGAAMGPLLAALFIRHQQDILWLVPFALFGIFILQYVSRWYANNLKQRLSRKARVVKTTLSRAKVFQTLLILTVLMFAKYVYMSCMQNYFTFYTMQQYGLEVHEAQLMLFLYLGGIALGTIIGGPIGDRIGARAVIWVSILGVLPFTLLLPFVNLWQCCILTFIIGLILASAFPAIVVFAQELVPERVGTIAGFLFGLSFGIGAISASVLGMIGDVWGLHSLFIICAFLPLLGLIAALLPNLKTGHR